jgi:hypothetical protein
MTIEQNQPQAAASPQQQGQAPQGQTPSQGHRRRRRRRKGGAAKGQTTPQANGQPSIQASGQSNNPAAGQSNNSSNGSASQNHKQKSSNQARFAQNNNNGNGGGGNGNGQGGSRRKSKQRRQQVFVGPMDHSYRVANGNLADGPPSTIEFRSVNGNGNGYHIESPMFEPPAAPIREDAPTRIFFFIEDLFFLAKIQETSRKLGVKVGFLKADKDIVARLSDVPEGEKPSLIVFDLNNAGAKPLSLIPKIKAKLKRGTSVIGFLSHLQGDLKVKATEAGCDMVMPRSAFSQNLPNLLRRHGLDEELEAVEA